jgi:hypothetical protein
VSGESGAGLDEPDRVRIVDYIAANPTAGEEIGSGVRKVRIAREGEGKRGGYRVLTGNSTGDPRVFLLIVFAKNEKDNISKAEAKALANEITAIKAAIEGQGKEP